MNKLINLMNDKFAPKLNKFTENVWISSISEAIMIILPMILVGSLLNLFSILNDFISWLPDLSPITTFSFGLFGLFISFLTPYYIMEKKGYDKNKIIAGATGLSLFIMLLSPTISEEGNISFILDRLGPSGMMNALIVGLFVGLVMSIFKKFSFFKKGSELPEFIMEWIDALIPITFILLIGWVIIYQLQVDMFDVILSMLEPLTLISQSFTGFLIINFILVFLYSFGMSPWVLMPILMPIWLQAINENAELVKQGLEPTNINTFETFFSGWLGVGGLGATLPLVILLLFAKSARLKAVGKTTLVPSLFNINEPIVYSAVAFNPILMIPFWLNALISPIIVYFALSSKLVPIPSILFQLWYTPLGISTYIVSGIAGLILLAIVLAVMFLIWFPFFKVYDKQEWQKEQEQ
ncbi:PTS sugar transporter subunit IIC [Lederbergia galactosidilytica]|uniref:Permease IIC component n=1 Tax=Lederbergia galactosidilytica TaxID=217031 RepID=A0A178A3P0_9BACI|nr:PTS transporter subunit EIIC [Lederbergia galactosidilytica]OAK74826.1 PTS cellobiose transporter subunit IIC [Lederbergia galactosidilytica]